MIYLIAMLFVALLIAGAMLSLASRKGEVAGVQDGHLVPCPGTPNCVCSECSQKAAFVLPLICADDLDTSWALAQKAVLDLGGEISRVDNGYLAATFQTPLFRFVDDVEMRLDRDNAVIHIRSASRVGHSDMGMNRRRVEAIRSRFKELLSH